MLVRLPGCVVASLMFLGDTISQLTSCFLFICVCVHAYALVCSPMPQYVCEGQKTACGELVLTIYHVGSGNLTMVLRLDGQGLY